MEASTVRATGGTAGGVLSDESAVLTAEVDGISRSDTCTQNQDCPIGVLTQNARVGNVHHWRAVHQNRVESFAQAIEQRTEVRRVQQPGNIACHLFAPQYEQSRNESGSHQLIEQAICNLGIVLQSSLKTGPFLQVEDLVESRAPHVGVNEKHAAVCLGESDSQIAHKCGFTFAYIRTGKENDAGAANLTAREKDGIHYGSKGLRHHGCLVKPCDQA